ncbi:MAG: L-serine ammonia-lyase, iron-sulfur-dependent, subunit alpha [Cellulosilyticaceae bacterium]
MLDRQDSYIQILIEELVPAMGCTEPICIAYAAAKATEVLGCEPDKIIVQCSGNIIKNVKSVTIPNSGNLRGIEASAVLGAVGGTASKELEVLNEVSDESISRTHELVAIPGYCSVELLDTVIPLHLILTVYKGAEEATVEIKHSHANISKITKNNEVLLENVEDADKYLGVFKDRSILNVADIKEFADTVDLSRIKTLLATQIEYNMCIANEGLTGNYGLGIGKILLQNYQNDVVTKIKAYASAGSEARMSGSILPVVTNSGSGNQGMASSIPIIIYATEKDKNEEQLYRSLAFANLITIHQKTYIGRLSAFCGAVSAACASGAAITYIEGGTLEQIKNTIINTLANISGIVCDGAKPSCASKIASSLDAAIMAHHLAMNGRVYEPFTGLVQNDVEQTIGCIGRLGKEGMKQTDIEILNMMLGN